MMEVRESKIDKMRTLVGASLITLFSQVLLYWGNLSVYVMSYLVHRGATGSLTIQPCWFHFSNSIGYALGKILAEILIKKRHRVKVIIAIGMFFVNCFYLVTAFCDMLSWSVYLFMVIILASLGNGMYECLLITHYVREWSRDHDRPWLAMAVFSSSGPAGAAILNLVITWWVNPGNLSPDFEGKTTNTFMLFSQDEIVDRVPSVMLILGVFNFLSQSIGLCLLRERDGRTQLDYTSLQSFKEFSIVTNELSEYEQDTNVNENDVMMTRNQIVETVNNTHDDDRAGNPDKDKYIPLAGDFDLTMEHFVRGSAATDVLISRHEGNEGNGHVNEEYFTEQRYDSACGYTLLYCSDQDNSRYESFDFELEDSERVALISETSKDQTTNNRNDFFESSSVNKPLTRFSSQRELSILCFVFFLLTHSKELTTSFFKVFGQTHIQNDHFFSTLGSSMAIPIILSIFSSHLLIAKFGCKLCLITLCSALTLISLSMYFAAMWNEGAYFVLTLSTHALVGFLCPSIVIHLLVLLDETNLDRSMARFSLISICSAVSSSMIAEICVPPYGWFSVFGSNAMFSTVALIIVVITFRDS